MPKLVNKFSFSKPKKPKITVFAAKSTDLMIPLDPSVIKKLHPGDNDAIKFIRKIRMLRLLILDTSVQFNPIKS